MSLKRIAGPLIFALYAAVFAYAALADTGPVGWINYAQQSIFGSSSTKVTILVALCVAMVVLVPIWSWIDNREYALRLRSSPAVAGTVTATATKPRWSNQKIFLFSIPIVIPLIWGMGYAMVRWFEHQQHEDMAATYEPIRLARDQAATVPAGRHLQVAGQLLWQRTVTFQREHSVPEYFLVPLVAEGWRPGDPVPLVLKVDGSDKYQAERVSRDHETVLGETGGALSVSATQEFAKMRVVATDATLLMRFVPSAKGAPAIADAAESYWEGYLVLAGILTAIYLLVMILSTVMLTMQDRKARAVAGQLRQR